MRKMSVRARLIRQNIAMIALIVLIGVLSVGQVLTFARALNGLMVDNYKSIRSFSLMLIQCEEQKTALQRYLNGEGESAMTAFADAERAFEQELFIAKNNITERGEATLITDIEEQSHLLRVRAAALQEAFASAPGTADSYYKERMEPIFAQLITYLQKARDLNETAMLNSKQRAEDGARRSLILMIGACMLIAGIGFLTSIRSSRRIVLPIESLIRAVRNLSAGQFSQTIELTTQDEIGELAQEFNALSARLHEYEKSTAGQLMAEKNKSLAIIRSISEPLIVLDQQYRIQLINPACESVFSLQESKLIGRHFLEAIPMGEVFDYISQYQIGGEPDRIIRLPYGSQTRYYRLLSTPMEAQSGGTAGYIVVFQNVTHLKELEQLKSEFLANISHELKTPLTSIIMGASLLEEDGDLPRAEIIHAISEDANRLTALVTDVLELSKMESGKTLFRFAPCSVGEVIAVSIKTLTSRAEQAGMVLSSSVQSDLPLIEADSDKLSWVFNSLIDNALKYIKSAGKIHIDAVASGESVMILVKDNGPGIPEASLNKVFDRFVRANEDIEVAGSGIGLAMVKEIIERHGGSVTCVSPPGEGATFILTLPIKHPQHKE